MEKNVLFDFKKNDKYLDFILNLVDKYVIPYHRAEVKGLEKIPEGPLLFVGNHNGAMVSVDSFIFLASIYKNLGIESVPHYLIHEKLLELPILKKLFMLGGAVGASHETAHNLLVSGEKIMVYPGGDIECMRPFSERNKIKFSGRRGYIKLALRENIPIVPVVSAGAHSISLVIDDLQWLAKLIQAPKYLKTHAWPLTLSFPWGLTLGPVVFLPFPSKIKIEVLEPVYFERTGEKAANDELWVTECAIRFESIMQFTLNRLSGQRSFIDPLELIKDSF